MTRAIRVMLVDDHAIVLEGYRRLLEKQDGIEVVAEATDSVTAYQRFKELAPDVIVADISMPGRGGIDLIRQIRQRDSTARIVCFTMHQNVEFRDPRLSGRSQGLRYQKQQADAALSTPSRRWPKAAR